eukprot:gene3956-4209_t
MSCVSATSPSDILQNSPGAEVAGGAADQSAAAPLPAATPPYRRWDLVSRTALAGGVLEVVCWEGERNLRVWLPPGYSRMDAWHGHPYQVLYLCDGQNLFGDCPTMSGNNWQAAQAAAQLISSGKLPPFIIVGVDHAGALRSLEYTPYTPGTGPAEFRADAAQWPGGGVTAYLERLKTEVIPWVAHQYVASTDSVDLAFGGSSFGGIAALAAALQGPENCGFGALLVESPSLWIGPDEAFLKDIQEYKGQWPQRVYIGMGGKEFSGNRQGQGAEHDTNFSRYMKCLYKTLTEDGLGPDRLAMVMAPDAAHTESAWRDRLPAALQFVCGGWWQRWAQRFSGQLFFTTPRRLKAGQTGQAGQVLFFNKEKSNSLSHLPREAGVTMVLVLDHPLASSSLAGGDWWMCRLPPLGADVYELDLKPTSLWRGEGIDFWSVQFQVPEEAKMVDFVQHVEAVHHAGGMLEVLELKKRAGVSSKQHWWDEKRIRVWLPPGYNFDADAAPAGGWPMLLMADGQNMFEDWLAHQGVSWNVGETAAGLLSVGAIPPAIMVGLDSAGPYRSYNYLPFPPGTGEGGFRGDAERWPGGGADEFLMRVTHEILPLLQQRYNIAQCPSRLAFGGGSFAGVTALLAAITIPHVFGGVLVESPSLWVAEGKFLADLAQYAGRLPERLSLGCGTLEYSATRDHDRPDVDALLLH